MSPPPDSRASVSPTSPEPHASAATSFLARTDYSRALSLSALALGNFVLFYVTNITLARNLPVIDFDDYSVAVSTVTVLSTVATLGLEKYALRCIPVYRERGDWSYSLGFRRFSLRIITAFSILLSIVLSLSVETMLTAWQADSHITVIVMASFLPVIATALFLVEIATANGVQIQAVVIYRFLMPASFFVLINLLYLFGFPSTAVSVAVCYGLAWVLSLAAISELVMLSSPAEVWHAKPKFLKRKWLHRAAPLLLNSLMLSVIASSGVIILEFIYTSESVVGTYAVVAQTGTFIVLLANTTNRFYLPLMSLFMERGDRQALQRLIRHRLAVVGGLSLSFLAIVFMFGEAILTWFGPGFREGYEALCVLAAGAAINALFSDSPYYLQFMKRSRSVFISTTFAMLINLTLTVWLAHRLGALGAAYGYTTAVSMLFVVQRLQTSHHFRHYWQSGNAD